MAINYFIHENSFQVVASYLRRTSIVVTTRLCYGLWQCFTFNFSEFKISDLISFNLASRTESTVKQRFQLNLGGFRKLYIGMVLYT